ncbi:hypothetical protein EF847_10100 [Actinobacteria bacterium YIM 96077]|uniref:IrrE N-terminal-like domain-containing protein n=1 Tax=Phytoactinopolyspora halophila TaxID=1981511 RepID=A0A329QLK8_9ACTN|nr:hypothetical protein [Phytoactinopolyspora halophila]AYY13001.1 hypothetical protein EF847_10100 [Actinobacteria bacterium YIM 96077]RAW13265.1 hypothetical protein DPM12_13125 [Phytoactinopolyspora halophila]
MNLRRIRQACDEQLHRLVLPEPFTIDAFCSTLARERGKPIRLMPMPDGADSPCGMWLATADTDWVFHQSATSQLHQEHIVLHELAHMIFGHTTKQDRSERLQTSLLPDLDPGMIASMLARASYTSVEERQAEMLAGLIGAQVRRRDHMDAERDVARAADVFEPES